MNNQNLHPMITILSLLSAALCALVLSLFFGFYMPLKEENRIMQRTLNDYRINHLRKQGGTTMLKGFDNLSYDLRSWDAGHTWYAVKDDWRGKTFTVLGEADSIYPNLLNHLEAMDRLTEHAQKNGAIGSIGEITQDEIKMLEESGFEVKQTHKTESNESK